MYLNIKSLQNLFNLFQKFNFLLQTIQNFQTNLLTFHWIHDFPISEIELKFITLQKVTKIFKSISS